MKFKSNNIFFGRNAYLLVTAAWLVTLSFIVDNYWGDTSVPGAQKAIQKDIQTKQREFLSVSRDTVLLNRLINKEYNEDVLQGFSDKKYFVFIYRSDSASQFTPVFWSTQIVQPDEAVVSSNDHSSVSLLANGWYVIDKKIIPGVDSSVYKLICLIPVKWEYYTQNKYLQNSFVAVDNIESQYEISTTPDNIAIKGISGSVLFYLHKTNANTIPHDNPVSLWLRIFAGVLVLLYIHILANFYVVKRGLWTGFAFLFLSLLALRILSYYYSIPVNFRQLEMFDPAIYGANNILRSLGDLFINSLLFVWLILFIRYHSRDSDLNLTLKTKTQKNLVVIGISVFMIIITIICGHIIRSLIADSQISFDVMNFFTLNIYTIDGFIILCCITIGYFFLIQILLHLVNCCIDEHKNILYISLAISGLITLTFKLNTPNISFDLSLIIWLLLFVFLMNYNRLSLLASKIVSSRFIFWVFFFCISITAIIVVQNRIKEVNERKYFAENLSNKADAAGERMMNIMLTDFRNDYLSAIFPRFKEADDNKFLKDSLINENFSGYLNKYDTKIYTFDDGQKPLYNEDSSTYNTLNAVLETQAKPTAYPDLFYYDVSYDRFNYISKKQITGRDGKLQGFAFILSRPKKYKSDALYPELFSKGEANSIESSTMYSFAVYNRNHLTNSYNNYPFPTIISNTSLANNEFKTKTNNGYDELWYNAGDERTIVIAKRDNFLMETITLFAYLFFAFLIITALFNLLNMLISGRFNLKTTRSFLQLTIRNQVHGTIILISMFSFIVIAIATILFFINRYHNNNRERLSRTIHIMENEVRSALDTFSFYNEKLKVYDFLPNEKLEYIINKLAEIHAADVNLYDVSGNLKVSSLPLPYNTGMVSTRIDPVAFYHLGKLKDVQFFQEQKIGELKYLSNYVPVRDETGKEYAYLNIPYFESQSRLKDEISNFLVTIINLNAFIFLMAGIIALFITNRITSSFAIITNKMKEINLGKINEEITWSRKDEIGELVDEYNKMVKKLDVSAAMLARSEREGAWREMARQVAHEIKNPLTPMKLNLQYLQMAIDTNSPNVKDISVYVARILVEQIDHLSKIATDFAQFANIGRTRNQVFNLNDAIKHVCSLYAANEKLNISITLHTEKIMIRADKTQINRLLTNIIQNAIQAVPENRDAEIEIMTKEERPAKIILSVKDNGSGIPERMKGKIFTPNFTTKTSGTGLGLAMCKGIVEKIEGRIWFETKEKEYTIFFVELPVIES
ncbi:MAG TPA: HAMP domain-containing sensor histidine kinase [Chitinophagaceae bacterium]|nr:HAMP domain-containing sensor histidine kinase [Chitinophagaceae bacterium]